MRLVGEDGKQIGVIKTADALSYAQERDLDLVEVAPDAKPPVCRVLDYSKFKYEQAQKAKQARKHQQQITIREIKFRPKIAQNDYDTKKGHVSRFLKGKDRVKVTIMFRGREVTHPERGTALLERLAEELSEIAIVEQRPIQDGRNMTMMLGPSKAVLADEVDGKSTPTDEPTPETGGGDSAQIEATPAGNGANGNGAAAQDADTAAAEPAASEAPAVAETAPAAPAEPEAAPAEAEAAPAKAEAAPVKRKAARAKAASAKAAAAPAEAESAPADAPA